MEEQYTFNGTPGQFAREVRSLFRSYRSRGQPTYYQEPVEHPRRPVNVSLLNQADDRLIGQVETRRDGATSILIVTWNDDYDGEARTAWEQLRGHLEAMDWRIQPAAPPPPTDAIFEEYYRRRAAGDRVTIKELAIQHKRNPSYLRRVKVEYDRRTGRKRSKR